MKFVCCGPLPDEPVINPDALQQSETLVLSLEARTRPVSWWESRLRLARFDQPPGLPGSGRLGTTSTSRSSLQINVERLEAEWVNSFLIGQWSTSTVGLEYRHE